MKKILSYFFVLFTALPGFTQTYNGTGGPISDNNQDNDFMLNVAGLNPSALNGTHGLVSVCVDITHPYVGNLELRLLSPSGKSINLVLQIGGSGDNFTNTCFDETQQQTIDNGTAPYTGSFRPQETIGNHNNGQSGNGNWILRIKDVTAQNAGTLNSWKLTFASGAPLPLPLTSSNLPIVLLTTQQGIPNEPKINGTMKIIYNGPGVRNYMSDTPNNYNGNIGIEKRGAYSQSLPQKPYSIELRDAAYAQKDTAILGMPPEHDWLLIANYNDKSFMRNTLPYKLFRKMDHWDAHSKFCEVLLNGSYQGIYLFMESLKRDSNRVDIADLDTNENAGINVTGGYIIKNDYWNASNSWQSNFHPIDHPNYDVHLVYHHPNPVNITPQQKTYIQTFINDFEAALYSPNFADTLNGYRKYMDVNSFVDYLIINELARNNDGFKKSSYFSKDKDKVSHISKLKAGPVWDFDWAWKDIPSGGCIFDATDGSGWAHHINDCGPDVNSPGWFVRLLQDTSFQNVFRCHWEKYRTTILDTTYLFSYIDSNALFLDEAQQRHYARWGHMGQATGTPEVQPPATSYQQEIYNWKQWIKRRIDWMDANVPGHAVNCDFTAVAENTPGENITIFPNPAASFFAVDNCTGIDRVTLTDVSGKELMRVAVDKNLARQRIDVTGLNDGLYIYRLYKGAQPFGKPGKLVILR